MLYRLDTCILRLIMFVSVHCVGFYLVANTRGIVKSIVIKNVPLRNKHQRLRLKTTQNHAYRILLFIIMTLYIFCLACKDEATPVFQLICETFCKKIISSCAFL